MSSPLGELEEGHRYPIDWWQTSHGDVVETMGGRVYQIISRSPPAANGMGEVTVHRLISEWWTEPMHIRVNFDEVVHLIAVTDWRTDEQRELERRDDR